MNIAGLSLLANMKGFFCLMNKKKALIIVSLSGFVRSFLQSEILLLQNKGYEVHCASNSNHPGNEGIIGFFHDKNIIFHQIDFQSSKTFCFSNIKSFFQLKKLSHQISFCLVHCHTPIAGALGRLAFKRQFFNDKTKVIYTTHGFPFCKGSSKKSWALFFEIEKYLSQYCGAIITINKEDFLAAQKMKCKKVYYMPGMGVDINSFLQKKVDIEQYRKLLGLNKDDFVILSIGELSQRKNHQVIIKALSLAKIPNSVFIICGTGMNKKSTSKFLIDLSKKLNVDLRLLGLRKDIAEIIKISDIGVLPSIREGLGLSGIEMIAGGLPLIGSDVQGIKDYVKDGQNGFLCKPNDAKSFAKKLVYLSDKNARFQIHKGCLNSVNNYDSNISYNCLLDIFEKEKI
jgi:glycosyltransferase involved in cell wall biosynthesis